MRLTVDLTTPKSTAIPPLGQPSRAASLICCTALLSSFTRPLPAITRSNMLSACVPGCICKGWQQRPSLSLGHLWSRCMPSGMAPTYSSKRRRCASTVRPSQPTNPCLAPFLLQRRAPIHMLQSPPYRGLSSCDRSRSTVESGTATTRGMSSSTLSTGRTCILFEGIPNVQMWLEKVRKWQICAARPSSD